ncbi:Multidrug resistance protein MdtA [Synechococcus sp. CBW1107]|nr:Multidrug resistance protein MdtA [Synechococcus sp. CBW1107]
MVGTESLSPAAKPSGMLPTSLRRWPVPGSSAATDADQLQRPAWRWPPPRRLIAAAALLALGLAGGGWLVWHQRQIRARRADLAARTAPVERRDVILKVTAAGSIRPTTPVNISPKQPGRVTALSVDQGDRVSAGQVLARMDDSNLLGSLLRAQGTVAAALANLEKLQAGNRPQEIEEARRTLQAAVAEQIAVGSTYRSNLQLYGSGAIARVAFDASRSAFLASEARVSALRAHLDLVRAGSRAEDIAAARAQLQQARGDLATIQAQVEDTVIRAPFAGVITQKYADVGAFVTPTTSASATSSATSSSILALASQLEAVANVAEVDVGAIRPGQAVDLQVDAFPRQVFRGTVRLVAPEAVVEDNVTSFQVRIALGEQARARLRSGMNLTASVLVGRQPDALLIPTPAIVSERGGTGVMVPGAGQRPQFRPVQVGATIGASTVVVSGLQDGDRVYVSAPGRRRPNSRPVTGASPFQQPRGQGRMPR